MSALKSYERDFLHLLSLRGEPVVDKFIGDAVATIADHLTEGGSESQSDASETEKNAGIAQVLKWGARYATQLIWGSQAGLTGATARNLIDRLQAANLDDLIDRFALLLRWAIDYRHDDGHTGMLLTMGRDHLPGEISLSNRELENSESTNHRSLELSVSLPPPSASKSRKTQERVMREIAQQWGGELRTNPSWAFLNNEYRCTTKAVVR